MCKYVHRTIFSLQVSKWRYWNALWHFGHVFSWDFMGQTWRSCNTLRVCSSVLWLSWTWWDSLCHLQVNLIHDRSHAQALKHYTELSSQPLYLPLSKIPDSTSWILSTFAQVCAIISIIVLSYCKRLYGGNTTNAAPKIWTFRRGCKTFWRCNAPQSRCHHTDAYSILKSILLNLDSKLSYNAYQQ